MTARDNLFWALWDNYTQAQKNEFIDAFTHELAEQLLGHAADLIDPETEREPST